MEQSVEGASGGQADAEISFPREALCHLLPQLMIRLEVDNLGRSRFQVQEKDGLFILGLPAGQAEADTEVPPQAASWRS